MTRTDIKNIIDEIFQIRESGLSFALYINHETNTLFVKEYVSSNDFCEFNESNIERVDYEYYAFHSCLNKAKMCELLYQDLMNYNVA